MEEFSQIYVPKIFVKLANIDTAYCLMAIALLILIVQVGNIIDIFYFGVVTYYYVKIKIHRWKLKK